MSDCANVDIRDRLPEYLNGTLGARARAEVEAHLASCAECADELALLRLVREAVAEVRPVNVAAIVAALPKQRARPKTRSWRQSQAFQIAAAVSFIALGGVSLAVTRSFFGGEETVVAVDTTSGNASAGIESGPVLSFSGSLSDLGDEDLEALLSALDNIEALPVAEPSEVPLVSGVERQGS
jgi:anti-sigma factor RsiW